MKLSLIAVACIGVGCVEPPPAPIPPTVIDVEDVDAGPAMQVDQGMPHPDMEIK